MVMQRDADLDEGQRHRDGGGAGERMPSRGPNAASAKTAHASNSGARVVPIPPPVYYVGAFAVGVLLQKKVADLSIGAVVTVLLPGCFLAAAGLGLTVAGVLQTRRAGTTIVPHKPVSTLLTSGAYRLSRNPMYTGLAMTHGGSALIADSWWPLITLPVALYAIRVLAIAPEEKYLADRFGDDYRRYRANTPRWLGGRFFD